MTLVKAKIPFSLVVEGAITSVRKGETVSLADATATALVNAGLAEAGTTTYTTNGAKDDGKIVVNVAPVKLTYDKNGGTGSNPSAVTVGAGTPITLNDGSGLTPPEGKQFKGWGTSSAATEVVASPLAITANTTIYAVWEDAPAEEPANV